VVDEISLASYEASVANSLTRCFAPWSQMPPEVWAEEIYRLPDGRRFRWDYAPYSKAMFLSMFDRHTVETIFEMYSRGLKSTAVLLAIGYIIDQAPRRILSMWPTNSQAEKWSKDNLTGELFDTTPPLNFLGSQTGRRISSNTLLHKLFPGGLIDIFGANAPGDMRRAKGSFLYVEEIDAIQSEQTDEGDQIAIFYKRGDEYPDTIRVAASYPALQMLNEKGHPGEGHSRIDAKLRQSDENYWYSTCVKCGGEPFVMHRVKHLRYDKDKPEGARMECPRCKEFLSDAQRYDMAHKQGFDNWKPTRPFRGKRGFHANAMLWPHPVDVEKFPGGWLQCLAQQEIDALASDKPKRALRVLVNTVDAEPYDPTDENEKPPDWKAIYDRREDYGLTVPMGGLYLTAFCDCQKNRLEVGWRAYGRREESWGMDHVVIDGYIGHPEVWRDLRKELGRAWIHESGAPMFLGMSFVDGGQYAEDVYRFFQGLARNPEPHVTGHCQASKGVGLHPHPIVTHGKMNTVARVLKGRYIGTWQAKDRVYERLRMVPEPDDQREGIMHYNLRYAEEYFQGLTIETATQKINGDQVYNTYKDEVTGNEPLDIEVGCLAALRLHPRNFDALKKDLRQRAEQLKSGDKKEESKRQRKRSDWMDWR
jgi:phage terminase large subunit GpA-like protein